MHRFREFSLRASGYELGQVQIAVQVIVGDRLYMECMYIFRVWTQNSSFGNNSGRVQVNFMPNRWL